MKILLLGKNGQLGRELQRSLAPLGALTAWGRDECDLAQTESLYAKVMAVKPNVIVNAAAYTAVDQAESEPALAHTINAAAPALLAQVTLDMGCRLFHYSTDYVFDGSGDAPWAETSPTAPLNVYGKSKLAGEEAITASGCKYFIFRTSWIYARNGSNFAKTMLRLASERDALSIIDDQVGAPTDAAWLADMTFQVLSTASQLGTDPKVASLGLGVSPQMFASTSGIFHAAASGEVSWHGYASYLIAKAREMGFSIKVSPENIKAVTSSEYVTAANRPHNSRLDCSKLTHTFSIQPPPWQQGVDRLLEYLKP